MKNSIIKKGLGILGVAVFSMTMFFNTNLINEDKLDLDLSTLIATNVAEAECSSSIGFGDSWKITFHSACSWTCTNGGTNSCPL